MTLRSPISISPSNSASTHTTELRAILRLMSLSVSVLSNKFNQFADFFRVQLGYVQIFYVVVLPGKKEREEIEGENTVTAVFVCKWVNMMMVVVLVCPKEYIHETSA